MRHLLGLETASRDDLESLLDDADGFVEVLDRPIPKVPALRGKTVATVFFEPSTRTRLSFERAAKALSADTLSFSHDGDRTVLRYEADIRLKWPYRIVEPFLGSKFDSLGDEAEAGLTEALANISK